MAGALSSFLPSIVTEASRRFGDQAALVAWQGWSLDHRDLDRLSDEAAVGLARLGVGAGDVIALCLPSTPDYVVAYVAAAKIGAVTAGVNPRLAPPEQAAVLEVAEPAVVLAGAAGDEPTGWRTVPVVPAAERAEEILSDLRVRGEAPRPVDADLDRPVALVFTSGTTGTPKGAVFTDRELQAIVEADTGGRWGGGGSMLAGTQFAHVGFMTKLPWYLQTGSTMHLLDRWRARDVLALIDRWRMPSIGGVAPQLALLLQEPSFDEFDLTCVRTIVMGGALSPPALVTEARDRLGAAYSIRYSSTESGGVGTATAFDAADEEALFTVGRPRAGVALSIRDEDGEPVADRAGVVGEIWLRSPTMFRGYWNDPAATSEVLGEGWLHTGDLGTIDDEGCLRLAGRSKELYIRGGYNVYPVEVEAVLASHPLVREVAIVPRADDVMGEVGVAVVVLHPGRPGPVLDELRRFGRERLASYKLPEDIQLVDRLPLTAMQKLDRAALARLVQKG